MFETFMEENEMARFRFTHSRINLENINLVLYDDQWHYVSNYPEVLYIKFVLKTLTFLVNLETRIC